MTDTKPTPAKSQPGMRPLTVTAAAIAVLASGIFAVIAALSLYGEHDYLTTQANKGVLTAKQITSATNVAVRAFDSAKKNHNAGQVASKLKDNLAKAKNDDTSAVVAADVTDQANKAKKAAKSAATSTAFSQTLQSNLTKLQTKQRADAKSQASGAPGQQLIRAGLLLVIGVLLAFGAWRGRYWARWAIIGVWVLSTIMGLTAAGIGTLIGVFNPPTPLPIPFATTMGLCAFSMLVAVILIFLPTSARYLALSRPAPRPGQPQRRGLFAPRVPPAAANRGASVTKPAATRPAATAVDRSRTKKRPGAANEQAIAKGAELARSRAKASKSRRSGEA